MSTLRQSGGYRPLNAIAVLTKHVDGVAEVIVTPLRQTATVAVTLGTFYFHLICSNLAGLNPVIIRNEKNGETQSRKGRWDDDFSFF